MSIFPSLVAMTSILVVQTPAAEFIADRMPTASCHASTVVELANGELLAAWFGGTQEGAPDVGIWTARRRPNGWTVPTELVREPHIATYNPVLFHAASGLLWLYYKFGPEPGLWTAGRLMSRDEGRTWSPVEHLPAGLLGPIRSKPLLLPKGVILAGSSVESYGSWACWIARSTDDGESWQQIGPIAAPHGLEAAQPKPGQPHGIIQPALVDLGDGHIRLYARATNDIGRICQSDSHDNGLTWSAVTKTDLRNPNSGIDAVRLRDGRLVIAYNNTSSGRTPLNLAVSATGDKWVNFRDLETAPGEYSYPALIQARNGDLLVTYTWNRVKIRFVRLPLPQ